MEGPELLFVVGDRSTRFWLGAIGFGTLVDPGAEGGEVFFGEWFAFAFWGHFAGDQTLDEEAFGGVAGEEARAAVAAFGNVTSEAEVEVGFFFVFVTVAVEAVGLEEGADVLFDGEGFSGGCWKRTENGEGDGEQR